MAGLTAADSITAATHTQAFDQLQESVFYNNEVFRLFQTDRIRGGGATFNVKHHYSANSSVTTFAEGDAAGVPGTESYITAQWPVQYYKGVMQVTGHARDYLKNDSPEAAFFPQIALEMQGLMKAMVDRASVDMIGTGTTAPVGIQGIVDDSGTVAGLLRSTYTWFAAQENAIAGSALAISDLDIIQRDVMDAEAAGNPNMWLTSYTQIQKVQALGLRPVGTASTSPMSVVFQPGGKWDIGSDPNTLTWAGKPIVPLRDLTNSVWLYIQQDQFRIVVMREWKIEPLGKTDDSEKFLATYALGIACLNPKFNGKVTGA